MAGPRELDTRELLIPSPIRIERRDGVFDFASGRDLVVGGYLGDLHPLDDVAKEIGLRTIPACCREASAHFTFGSPSEEDQARAGKEIDELLSSVSDPRIKDQSYVLLVGENGGIAVSGGERGLFYAAQTLAKLIGPDKTAPRVAIKDAPVLPNRCVLLDASRGRVPTAESMMELIKLISELKYNQLTFNVEHVLECPARPETARRRDVITLAEMARVVEFAASRRVQIIPFQQSLGHMREILSLPEYRELAYDKNLLWSLDPSNELIYRLLEDYYDAWLEVCPSSVFHVGCDEPFDLIKNFDAGRFGGKSVGLVIRDHLIRLHEILGARGASTMVWADALVQHPEIIPDLPRDMVLCHWSYGTGNLEGHEHYRSPLEIVAESGNPFYACTTTWTLMKTFPDLAVMEANHKGLVPMAKSMGAEGMMVTIWGDMGHMNPPGTELYPLAYSAGHAWEEAPEYSSRFNKAFAWTVHRDPTGEAGDLVMELDQIHRVFQGPAGMGAVGLLLLFDEPLASTFFPAGADPKEGERIAMDVEMFLKLARRRFTFLEASGLKRRDPWLDNHLPYLQLEILAVKLGLIRFLKANWPELKMTPRFAEAYRKERNQASEVMARAENGCREISMWLTQFLAFMESRWLTSSKESDLERNRERFRRLIMAWIARAVEFKLYKNEIDNGAKIPSLEAVMARSPSNYEFNFIREMGLEELL